MTILPSSGRPAWRPMQRPTWSASWLSLCVMAWMGCGGPAPERMEEDVLGGVRVPAPEGPQTPKAPPSIALFQATPAVLEPGQDAVLEWAVTGATQLSLEPGGGPVTGSRLTVHPQETTTYTLTASSEAGSATASVTITVSAPPTEPPPTEPPPTEPPPTEPPPTEPPPTEEPPPEPPPVATWAPLSWAHELPAQYDSDVYRWLDARGEPRTAVLTRNTGKDPGGSHGGMLRQFRYRLGSQERVATGTGARSGPEWIWNGWGYLVSHGGNGAVYTSSNLTGQYRQVFVGRHHAVHEFTWDLPIGGVPVRTTVHWFFSTGRDHPVYAVTFDSSAAGPGGLGISADSRTPYGDIAWDGDGTQAWVDGVTWGDKYKFASREEPLTAQSKWDHTEQNKVPYASTYSRTADAEMGSVQTLDWKQHNTGGTWFNTNWARSWENRDRPQDFGSWNMPPNWNWPYQLCQYEMGDSEPTRSKRLAWGLMYGAVGSTSYYGYGYEGSYSGHPYQSYSVFMVMGRQSGQTVGTQVSEVEHLLGAELRASQGSVVEEGAGGVGRADTVRYAVPGYNSLYGAYELQAATGGAFSASLNAAAGELHNPLFLIRGLDSLPTRILLDGVPLKADLDYFASFDASTRRLWLTLHGPWSGSHVLSHLPASP